MGYKMFATDLDGTLLDAESRLSDKNKDALRRIQDKGVKTVISSGRSPQSLKRFEEQIGNIGPGCYGVGFNGGVVYETDTRRVIQKIKMDIPTARFILEHLDGASADILIYINDMLYMKELNDNTGRYVEIAKIPFEVVENFDGLLTEEPYKVMLQGTHEQLMSIYDNMKERVAGRSNIFFSGRNLLEFTHLDATKGNALRFLAGYLGIKLSEIIAVGDNFNDIPMFEAAGLGVAVANAEPEVAARADRITKADNNHDAVVEVIKEHILEELIF